MIRLMVVDVDGVLTDGSLDYGTTGGDRRTFNARDATGIRTLQGRGVVVALLTERRSHAVATFAEDVGVKHVLIGGGDRAQAVVDLQKELGIDRDATAIMGDDVEDIPVFLSGTLTFAPADAESEAREAATVVTKGSGGRGAFREAARHLISMNADEHDSGLA
jgi:3-deoxy-D-manno-octulosonate 8-phosphate phosphatase (KDO 8-P phosphatase)